MTLRCDQDGVRIDAFLAAAVPELSRSAAQQLLAGIRRQPVETSTLLGYQVGLRTSTQT